MPFALLPPKPFETTAELLASSGWPDGLTAVAEDDPTILYMWSSFFNELIGDGWLELATTSRSTKWELSTGAPAAGSGNDNDLDLDRATGAIYLNTSGTWAAQFVGGAGVYDPYTFEATAGGTPSSGCFRFDNATQNLALEVHLTTLNALGQTYTIVEGKKTDTLYRIQKVTDPTAYLTFRFSGNLAGHPYQDWAIQVVESSAASPFTDGDLCVISWLHAGGIFLTQAVGGPLTVAALNGDWGLDTYLGGISKYVSGAWALQYQPPAAPQFGDGSDAAAAFDGVNAVTGASRVGTTYTLTRDVFYSSMTVSVGVTVVTAGYRIFVSGTLTNSGVIHNDGGAAAGVVAGAAAASGIYGGGTAGGADATNNNSTSVGVVGAAVAATGWHTVGAVGGTGGNGNGGVGGTIRTKTSVPGFHDLASLLAAFAIASSTADVTVNNVPVVNGLAGGTGGGTGGRTTGGTATTKGAGGGGAGILVICARLLDNSGGGVIRANGGNGANAAGGTCVTGGGGGGGGGCVLLAYSMFLAGTETANGGTKGAGINGAAAAADGTAGRVVKVPV